MGADTGQSGNLKQPTSRRRADSPRSTEAREQVWLSDVRRGYSIKEIARREGLSCRRIQHGVCRARERGNSPQIREFHLGNELPLRNTRAAATAARVATASTKRPPILVPLFPIGAFTPGSACPHPGPIPAGSVFCCMVCSQSGVDDHPALKRDPRTEPRPESRPHALVSAARVRETRKQRRQRLSAAQHTGLNMASVPAQDLVRPPSRSMIRKP